MSFPEALRAALDERGMSASDLARKVWGNETNRHNAARNRQLVSHYLQGTMRPQIGTVTRIARALDKPVDELASAAGRAAPHRPEDKSAAMRVPDNHLRLVAAPEAGKVRLQVNRVVDQRTALKIFDMLSA